MWWIVVAQGVGLWLALRSSISLSFLLGLSFCLSVSFILWIMTDHARKLYYFVLTVFIGFLAAFSQLTSYRFHQAVLPFDSKNITVIGVVTSIPEVQTNRSRFEFNLQSLLSNHKSTPLLGKVQLLWVNAPTLRVGDQWQLVVHLEQPQRFSNPGGFNYQQWLLSNNILATGYVITNSVSQNKLLPSHSYPYFIDRERENIARGIASSLGNQPMLGFIQALAVGVRDQITAQQWQVLRNTGTNHLMAIAGLHIGLAAGFVYGLIFWIWRRSARLMLLIPAQQAAACAALIMALIYAAMAGFSLPTQRALIMLCVFLLAVLWRRYLPAWRAYFLALFIVLLLEPLAIYSESFWLSFVTVGLIIYASSGVGLTKKWQRWLHIQWIIAVGLIPLSLLFFQQVSLLGFLVNLIAIPWVGFFVLPLTLLGNIFYLIIPALAKYFYIAAAHVLNWFWSLWQKMANIQQLQWHMAIPNYYVLVITTIGILVLLAPHLKLLRCTGLLCFLPLWLWPAPHPQLNQAWFTLLQVPHGQAAVIQTKNHVLVYETISAALYQSVNQEIVTPFLRTRAIKKIDLLIVNGNQQIDFGQWSDFAIKQISICNNTQPWQWDGINFRLLSDKNSCILRMSIANKGLLMIGDLNHAIVINQNMQASIFATVLHQTLPQSLLTTINPQYLLFSEGYLNQKTSQQLKMIAACRHGITCLNTAENGAMSFEMSEDGIKLM